MIVQTPPLLHISPMILLIFDDFGGECFFDDFPPSPESFLTFRPFPLPIFLFGPSTLTIFGRRFIGAGNYLGLNIFAGSGFEPSSVDEGRGAPTAEPSCYR